MPGFVQPQLATLRTRPPSGAGWIHEIKLDGYRGQAHVGPQGTRIYTRGGHDWSKMFAPLVAALSDAAVDEAVIDGEIVVVVDERTDFGALQADLAARRADRMLFYAFDLLHLDGYDLGPVPLTERKRLLKGLFDRGLEPPVVYSDSMDDGEAMFDGAGRLGWEGIVSKRADAPYRSGDRSLDWQKIKTSKREHLVIVGYVPATGGIAALHVARRDGDSLVYAGKVGTGFSVKVGADLRRRLAEIETAAPPIAKPPPRHRPRWVRPVMSADVEYRDITASGHLRHASFKGLAKAP
ncbi:non-homologous end-joining DNA ligase [Rhodopseudomonas sp. AAP120]|nr:MULTISPECIES: non-homologous end-joining DNA ligase [Rhodopseudomonas]